MRKRVTPQQISIIAVTMIASLAFVSAMIIVAAAALVFLRGGDYAAGGSMVILMPGATLGTLIPGKVSVMPKLLVQIAGAFDITVIILLIVAYIVLSVTIFYKQGMLHELDKRNIVLRILLDSVPTGVIRCLYDDDLTVKYYNDEFLKFYRKDYKVGKSSRSGTEGDAAISLKSLIYKDDVFLTLKSLKSQLAGGDEFELRFRLSHTEAGNGSGNEPEFIMLMCRGKKYVENNIEYLYCVILDITENIKTEQRQKIDQDRYRIVAEASDSVIFEYYLRDNKIICTNKFAQKFGRAPSLGPIPDIIFKSDFVYDGDMYKFKSLYNSFLNGSSGGSAELRLKKSDGNYIWCELRFSTIYDERGLPIRAVGKIIDIDKDRREKESLIKANQFDPFTELYNKVSVLKHIESFLKENSTGTHALFFIDIDKFKRVNDTHGHMRGDKVLLYVADILREHFRSTDITGRIGGDEFVVLLTHYVDLIYVKEKARNLLNAIRLCPYEGMDKWDCITASIGVALYPDDGNTLNQIYYKADIALYEAKNKGKDIAVFYGN